MLTTKRSAYDHLRLTDPNDPFLAELRKHLEQLQAQPASQRKKTTFLLEGGDLATLPQGIQKLKKFYNALEITSLNRVEIERQLADKTVPLAYVTAHPLDWDWGADLSQIFIEWIQSDGSAIHSLPAQQIENTLPENRLTFFLTPVIVNVLISKGYAHEHSRRLPHCFRTRTPHSHRPHRKVPVSD